MNRISAMSAALSVLLAAPLLMVSAVRAEAAPDFGAAVSLGFHVGRADVNVFYDSLAPYGDWVDTDRYGLCWTPRVTEQDWRPYYYGHWVYTDYGWTWVSDEEWGWGPYHYGRWAFDPAYGWVWVPGSVWAPAWVAWRWGDGYAGWAPLPPDVDPSMGPASFGIDPLSFVFVQDRYVADPVLVDRYVPPARNVTIVNVTRNVTNYTVVNDRVLNNGVPVQQVERVTGRAIPRVQVAEQTAPAPTRVRGNEVAMYRPTVPEASATTRPRAATGQRPPATTTHRSPAAAPPSTTDPAELQRRHAREQQALQAQEAMERERLRQIHEQEKAAPPPNVSPQQLQERQGQEERAQAEHEQRQKQAQQQRQARERQAAQQAQQQHQGRQQAQSEKPKNEKDKKKPENKQQ